VLGGFDIFGETSAAREMRIPTVVDKEEFEKDEKCFTYNIEHGVMDNFLIM
jgi:hypothetical protein